MDREYYKNKIELMLQDESTYKEINSPNKNKETLNKIKKLIREYANDLTKKEIDYITNVDHRPSNIYGLPKVHKCKEIIDAIKKRPAECIKIVCPESLTMRPIIARPQSVTSRLSDFIDKLLRPYLKVVKSYIRDDIDFLLKMP